MFPDFCYRGTGVRLCWRPSEAITSGRRRVGEGAYMGGVPTRQTLFAILFHKSLKAADFRRKTLEQRSVIAPPLTPPTEPWGRKIPEKRFCAANIGVIPALAHEGITNPRRFELRHAPTPAFEAWNGMSLQETATPGAVGARQLHDSPDLNRTIVVWGGTGSGASRNARVPPRIPVRRPARDGGRTVGRSVTSRLTDSAVPRPTYGSSALDIAAHRFRFRLDAVHARFDQIADADEANQPPLLDNGEMPHPPAGHQGQGGEDRRVAFYGDG